MASGFATVVSQGPPSCVRLPFRTAAGPATILPMVGRSSSSSAAGRHGSTEARSPALPPAVEEACYEAWSRVGGETGPDDVDALCRQWPDHGAAIRALFESLARGQELLRAVPLAPALPEIDNYEVEQVVGRGGFGTVYRGRQTAPVDRAVAIKVLRWHCEDRDSLVRFAAEGQVLAKMQHRAIATVFDVGIATNGQPFMAMELIDGPWLTRFCDQHRYDIDARLRLFVDVCAGVAHAHQRGVIHRDLKPSNILVAHDLEGPRPVIIDFGLAKALASRGGQSLTVAGGFVGTPTYTSPEQLEGGAVDTRTDVYALGLVLYELLTGDLPQDRRSVGELPLQAGLRRILEGEIEPPSRLLLKRSDAPALASKRNSTPARLARHLRGDVEVVVRCALERNPERRYPTVSAFASDVRRVLEFQPIAARRPTLVYELSRLVRRHRATVVAVVGLVLALLLGAAALLWGARRVEQAEKNVAAERRRADWGTYTTSIRAAKLALDAGQAGEAQRQLAATDPALRGWEHDWILHQVDDALFSLTGVCSSAGRVHWLSDSELLVAPEKASPLRWAVGSSEATEIPISSEGYAIVPTTESHRVIAIGRTGGDLYADLIDTSAQTKVRRLASGLDYLPIAVSPDGTHYAWGTVDAPLRIQSLGDSSSPTTEYPVPGWVVLIEYAPDGNSLYWGDKEGRLARIDLATGQQRTLVEPGEVPFLLQAPQLLRVAPRRNLLVLSGGDPRIVVREADTGALRYALRVPEVVREMVIDSSDGVLYAVGGWGKAMVAAWKLDTGEPLGSYDGHALGVFGCALSPDRSRLATMAHGGTVKVWPAKPPQDLVSYSLGRDCRGVGYDVASGRVAYSEMDGSIAVRELRTGAIVMHHEASSPEMLGERAALTTDAMFVVGWDGILRRFRVRDASIEGERRVVPGRISAISVSPDGLSLAISSWDDMSVQVLDAVSLDVRWRHEFDAGSSPPAFSEFSADGKGVFCGRDDGELLRFAVGDGELEAAARTDQRVADLAPVPDEPLIVTGDAGGGVYLRDAEDLTVVRQLARLSTSVYSVAVAPDSQRVATSGADGKVKILDFATGTLLLELGGGTSSHLAWSRDGRRLYARFHERWGWPAFLHKWEAGAADRFANGR